MTLFHMNVEKLAKRPPELPLEAQTLMALKARLPAETIAIETAALPAIVICHKGRALGLHMMMRGTRLSLAETDQMIKARAAGMRVEVARGLEQALSYVREMGVVLKDDDRRGFRDHYRGETRRRS